MAVPVTRARPPSRNLLPRGLMAGTSQRPPSMYWCVGTEGSAVGTEGSAVFPGPAMETQNGK